MYQKNCRFNDVFRIFIIIFSLAFLTLYSSDVLAAEQPSGVLTNVSDSFAQAMKGWYGSMTTASQNIFYTLMTISFVWRFSMMAVKGGEMQDIAVDLIRTIMICGLFTFIIQNNGEVIRTIFKGFAEFAKTTTSLGHLPDPSNLISVGTDAAAKIFKSIGWGDALSGDVFLKIFVAGAVMLLFIFISINVLLALIAFYFMLYVGVILLGLWGADWTKDTAIMYLKALLARAIEYYGMIMVVAVALEVFNTCLAQIDNDLDDGWLPQMTLLASAVVTYLTVTKLPAMLSQCVAPIQSAGVSASGFAAATGLAAAAGTMMMAAKTIAKSAPGMAASAAGHTAKGLYGITAGQTAIGKSIADSAANLAAGTGKAMQTARSGAAAFFGRTQGTGYRNSMASEFQARGAGSGVARELAGTAQQNMRNYGMNRSEAMQAAERTFARNYGDPYGKQNSVSSGNPAAPGSAFMAGGAGGNGTAADATAQNSGSTGSAASHDMYDPGNPEFSTNMQRLADVDLNGSAPGNGSMDPVSAAHFGANS